MHHTLFRTHWALAELPGPHLGCDPTYLIVGPSISRGSDKDCGRRKRLGSPAAGRFQRKAGRADVQADFAWHSAVSARKPHASQLTVQIRLRLAQLDAMAFCDFM
eukprot:SAG11_NODE_619_length_8173_cov_4.837255_6_plen_105_part_00